MDINSYRSRRQRLQADSILSYFSAQGNYVLKKLLQFVTAGAALHFPASALAEYSLLSRRNVRKLRAPGKVSENPGYSVPRQSVRKLSFRFLKPPYIVPFRITEFYMLCSPPPAGNTAGGFWTVSRESIRKPGYCGPREAGDTISCIYASRICHMEQFPDSLPGIRAGDFLTFGPPVNRIGCRQGR